jgi:hypothetical protein
MGRNSDDPTKPPRRDAAFDLDALLHPARAFSRPADVVADLDLTLSEKRAILASWASEACAAEAMPPLWRPEGASQVGFDDIVDAIRHLDREARFGYQPRPNYRRVLDRRMPGVFGRKPGRSGSTPGSSLN